MAHVSEGIDNAMQWAKIIPFFSVLTVVTNANFIATYINRYKKFVAISGYGFAVITLLLIYLGFISQKFTVLQEGILYWEYGKSLYILGAGNGFFLIISVIILIKSLRSARNPEKKNSIGYLLVGLFFILLFGLIYSVVPMYGLAVDHFGSMFNALIITYAIAKKNILDIKLVIRKGLVSTALIIGLILPLGTLIILANYYFKLKWYSPSGLIINILMLIGFATLFSYVKPKIDRVIDKLYYGRTYDARKMIIDFAKKMCNVMEIEELAGAMLRPITDALSAKQVSLLFQEDDKYCTRFSEHLDSQDGLAALSLRKEGPIVSRLEQEDSVLYRDILENDPTMKGIWQQEWDSLNAAEVELLCPIKSKKRLIAILAVSKKKQRSIYNREDVDLLMALSNQAAAVIENAQIYSKAKERANTDELTSLYNHRFFHERLTEEIARSSRFGTIFSIVFIDLDMFKNYNDIFGHLSGDQLLKQVGDFLKVSIRDTDIPFRYGGDEFALIMPETNTQESYLASERIRQNMVSVMDIQGLPITCSMGIATWPTDGVSKEDLIRASDAALYYAKQTGKNKTCLASKVALSEVFRLQHSVTPKNDYSLLSTIYALAATVDAKDHYTYGHSKKVCKYATDIAHALGYNDEDLNTIRNGALLHDIGKIGIPDYILQKNGPLAPDEQKLIKTHPNLGVAIIKNIDSLQECLAAIQYHHEFFNGKGYPYGLKGENIPLDARILAVADAFDAMTSERPYRKKKSEAEAFKELAEYAGTQFDPNVVNAFLKYNNISEKTASLSNKTDVS
jgi:diguanylate cyclase (GGDEF)-like protein/putative nucleotidyltransferase with HDIG domain